MQQSVPTQLVPAIVFIALAWNLPEQVGLEAYDQQRLLQICCLTATTACLFLIPTVRASVWQALASIPRLHVVLLALGLSLGLFSALTADLPRWAIIEWGLTVQLLVLGVAVASARLMAPTQTDSILAGSIMLSAGMYAVALVASYSAMAWVRDTIDLTELYPRFSNPRFAGQFFSLVLPVLLALAASGRRFRWAPLLTAGIFVGFALSQGTRGTWLGLVGAIVAVALARPASYKLYFRTCLAGVLLGVTVYLSTAHWLPAFLDKPVVSGIARASSVAALTDDSGRKVIWRLAAEQTVKHPLLGTGPMNFAATYNRVGNHPHNSVLQLLAEWGIPATAALLIPCIVFLIAFAKAASVPGSGRQPSNEAIRCGLFAALMAGGIQSLVDGVLVVPTTQTLLFILAGWAAGFQITRDQPQTMAVLLQPNKLRLLAGSFAATTGLVLLFIAARTVWNPESLTSHYCQRVFPRFWVQGAIGPSDFPERGQGCAVASDSE